MESILLLILPRLPKYGGFLQSIVINPCSSHSLSRCPVTVWTARYWSSLWCLTVTPAVSRVPLCSPYGQLQKQDPIVGLLTKTFSNLAPNVVLKSQGLIPGGNTTVMSWEGVTAPAPLLCLNQVAGPSRVAPTTYHTAHSPSFSHARSPTSQFYDLTVIVPPPMGNYRPQIHVLKQTQ